MQMPNSERLESVGSNSFYEAIDFPTEEELLAALDASLEQSPWLPRPISSALVAASSHLAGHWEELVTTSPKPRIADNDEHYVSWVAPAVLPQELPVEPDFLAGLAKFLTDRLRLRMQEVEQAQRQLQAELAKLIN